MKSGNMRIATAMLLLVCFSFATIAAPLLPETDKIIKDLPVTVKQSTLLRSRVNKVEHAVKKTIDAISKAEKASKLISRVNSVLKVSKTVMLALQAIPEIRPVVSEIENVISKIDEPIDKVDKKVKSFVKKLKPVKKRLQQVDKILKKAIKGLKKIADTAKKVRPPIVRTANCIKTLNNRAVRKKLASASEFFSGKAEPMIAELNTILTTVNRDIDRINSYVKKLTTAVRAFDPFSKALNAVWSKIRFINPVFDEIKKILNYKIKVPYSFKVKIKTPFHIKVRVKVRVKVRFKVKIRTWKVWKWHVSWKWKWKWSWKWQWKMKKIWKWKIKVKVKTFSFSVNDILKGINTGIGFVNKELMRLAHKVIDPIMKKLHIKFPTLPGIKTLLYSLHISHVFFDNFMAELAHIKERIEGVIDKIPNLHNFLSKYAVKCKG